jgi:hypothetical protein
MYVKKIAAKASIAAALGAMALGVGVGLAQADPNPAPPIPVPGDAGHFNGANWGGVPRDRDDWGGVPRDRGDWGPPRDRDDWRFDRGDVPPLWAPPAPPPPDWDNGAPVVWNAGFNGWGLWINGAFIPL